MPMTPNHDTMTKPRPTQALKLINEAVDMISTGLLILDQNSEFMAQLIGPKAVDHAARLNAQYNALEKIVRPLKEPFKAEALEHGLAVGSPETIRGENYQAVVSRIIKNVLDTDKVKSFFGRKLPQYMKEQEEIRVSFQTKV